MAKQTKKETKSTSLEVSAFDSKGKSSGKVALNPQVFDGKVNQALIHQAVVAYLANQRRGLASAKTRGEVSGGGIKPWRQKGTGRARVGSIRSPLWRKGGVTFGPKPHSFTKDLPKTMKTLALKSALNAKLKDAQILILSDLSVDTHKTKPIADMLTALKTDQARAQLVVGEINQNLKLASRNIERLNVARACDIHAIDVMNCKKLIMTKDALKTLEERVLKCLQ